MSCRTVRANAKRRAGWEVALLGEPERVTSETLDEATRVAYMPAVHLRGSVVARVLDPRSDVQRILRATRRALKRMSKESQPEMGPSDE